jgi:hypothetical protein
VYFVVGFSVSIGVNPTQVSSSDASAESVPSDWTTEESYDCNFADKRLCDRYQKVLRQIGGADASSMPWACEDWANAKAAYRFFDNDRIEVVNLLGGHFAATGRRARALKSRMLILHDTTQFSFNRADIGYIGKPKFRPRGQEHLLCGIMMHSSLVVTEEGLPLGLAAARLWNRKEFKGANALKKIINPTRVPIEEKESRRWLDNIRDSENYIQLPDSSVHIGDREADIFELFSLADQLRTSFLVRTCADRLVHEDGQRVGRTVSQIEPAGTHSIEVTDKQGLTSKATLEVRFAKLTIRPPVGKQKHYRPLSLTVIHAEEKQPLDGRAPILWKLVTNLSVETYESALEKLRWYALRWRIETFHKVLKSGCRIEESGLRTTERLMRMIAACCVVAWRVYWSTMLGRCTSEEKPDLVFTKDEIEALDRMPERTPEKGPKTVASYLKKVASLGGHLGRAGDSPPGPIVIWRGFRKLSPIVDWQALKPPKCG